MLTAFILTVSNLALYVANPRHVWRYRQRHRRLPNLAPPRGYAERMLWRRIVDRNPLFVVFSDKLACKAYGQRVCPDLAVPRTLWVGSDANAIPDDVLQGDVFVKANHGYDFNHRVRGGAVDRVELKRVTDQWLRTVHGVRDAQWAYSQVTPRLFVEETVGDAAEDLIEISVNASNGVVIRGSVNGHNKLPNKWSIYQDSEGRPRPGSGDRDDAPRSRPLLPDHLKAPFFRAVDYARRLSVGVDYARYDFMWNGSQLFMGEITVYPARGVGDITNSVVRSELENGWDLSASGFFKAPHTGLMRIYAAALARRLAS